MDIESIINLGEAAALTSGIFSIYYLNLRRAEKRDEKAIQIRDKEAIQMAATATPDGLEDYLATHRLSPYTIQSCSYAAVQNPNYQKERDQFNKVFEKYI